MNIRTNIPPACANDGRRPVFRLMGRKSRRSQQGISLLVILALLACMAIMVAANSTALALLKQELNRIDRQQRQRYGQGPGH